MFQSLVAIASKTDTAKDSSQNAVIFDTFSPGVATNRDQWTYDFSPVALTSKVKLFIKNYNFEVHRLSQEGFAPVDIDNWVNTSPAFLKWTDGLKSALRAGLKLRFDAASVRRAFYRPYTAKWIYFDPLLNQRQYQQGHIYPSERAERENRAIWIKTGGDWPFFALVSDRLVDLLPQGGSQCFPFYAYDEDGTGRRENITDWALSEFREHYKDPVISKWSIFDYVYGVLHHPAYREKFEGDLKRELPRVPFAPNFRAFQRAGQRLIDLHLNYEKLDPFELQLVETPGVPLSYRVVDKMRLNKEKTRLTVNPSLTLAGIPPEAFEYRLGTRSALDWVIDQYQVSTDARSGITSDPNREDDSQYIVRLVGQAIRVSMETVRIVKGLPAPFPGTA